MVTEIKYSDQGFEAAAFVALANRVWPRDYDVGAVAVALSHTTNIGAWEGEQGRLVGYVIVSRYVAAWHVRDLVVEGGRRRRGIARALLDDVFGRTDGAGRRGFTLEVRASNDAALKLYEAMGFRRQGIRRGYYTDNREDAVIMWRDASGVDAA